MKGEIILNNCSSKIECLLQGVVMMWQDQKSSTSSSWMPWHYSLKRKRERENGEIERNSNKRGIVE